VRKRLISLAVAPVLLLAGPAAAPAQEEQYIAPSLEAAAAPQNPAPAPTPSAGPEATQAVTQQVAELSQTDTEPSQTETDQSQTETTEDESQTPIDEPGQYCDPLAEDGCEKSGNKTDQQSGVESTAVAPATTVGGELASTGAPIGLFALVGSALLGAGAALRRLSRGTRAG
jgi:hypothetical protein